MDRFRRDFLARGAAAAAAGAAAALLPGAGCARRKGEKGADKERREKVQKAAAGEARVVLVQGPGVVGDGGALDQKRLARMLARGLSALAGTDDARAALSRWVRPVDRVGLKVNCLAGPRMSTHRALCEALVDLLHKTGLPRNHAVVFDRSDRDLRHGGFELRSGGNDYLCLGNDRAGYEKELSLMKSGASRLSVIAARSASVLINLPILKDHGIAGLSGGMKNNFGLIHNPNKFHLNHCDPHVAEVNGLNPVRTKQKLLICDALRVQVEGGPAFHPAGAATRDALYLATDPVALDVVLLDELEKLRAARKLPSLARDKRPARHVATAAAQGLGVGARDKITLVKLTVS